MEALSDATIAGLIGLGGGMMLGLAARLGKFCTLGAIEDALYASDLRGVRMWALALAVAAVCGGRFPRLAPFADCERQIKGAGCSARRALGLHRLTRQETGAFSVEHQSTARL